MEIFLVYLILILIFSSCCKLQPVNDTNSTTAVNHYDTTVQFNLTTDFQTTPFQTTEYPTTQYQTTYIPPGSCVFPYFFNGSCYAGCYVGKIRNVTGSFCPTVEIAIEDQMYNMCYGIDAQNAARIGRMFKSLNDTWKNCAFPFLYDNTCNRTKCIPSPNNDPNEPPWCPLKRLNVTDNDRMSNGRYCYEGNVPSIYTLSGVCYETNAQQLNVNFTDPNEKIIIRNSQCKRTNYSSPIGVVQCQSGFIFGYNSEACVRPTLSTLPCDQDRDCQPPASCFGRMCSCALGTTYDSIVNLCLFDMSKFIMNSEAVIPRPSLISLLLPVLLYFK